MAYREEQGSPQLARRDTVQLGHPYVPPNSLHRRCNLAGARHSLHCRAQQLIPVLFAAHVCRLSQTAHEQLTGHSGSKFLNRDSHAVPEHHVLADCDCTDKNSCYLDRSVFANGLSILTKNDNSAGGAMIRCLADEVMELKSNTLSIVQCRGEETATAAQANRADLAGSSSP